MATGARPNLLFLMTDHQRADSLGMVQAGRPVTPHLNALAADAARFDRCYTTCPLCVPARTALATGLYPTRHGVTTNDWQGATAGDHLPLHQALAQAGYAVAHVGVHHVRVQPPLEQRLPFARWVTERDHVGYLARQGIVEDAGADFAPFRRTVQERQGRELRTRTYSNTHVAPWPFPREHFKDLYFARAAAEWLAAPPPEPWALFLCLWAPHPPLRVPAADLALFPPEQLALPPDVGRPAPGQPACRAQGVAAQLGAGVTPEQWREVWRAHLALTHLADEALGQVLAALTAGGQAARTVTLFTVDHGDHLGQRAMYQKMELYEPAIRVPLLLRGPGIAPGTRQTPVSHLDVVPTLGELLSVPLPAGLDGRSLAAALAPGAEPALEPVFCQYSGNDGVGDIRRGVILGPHKYVYDTTPERELYDLAADPLERHNLAREPAAAGRVAQLHALLAVHAQRHGDWVAY
jgi:arylsulfatase A-like enzyme